jgi:hypothetical protein
VLGPTRLEFALRRQFKYSNLRTRRGHARSIRNVADRFTQRLSHRGVLLSCQTQIPIYGCAPKKLKHRAIAGECLKNKLLITAACLSS